MITHLKQMIPINGVIILVTIIIVIKLAMMILGKSFSSYWQM